MEQKTVHELFQDKSDLLNFTEYNYVRFTRDSALADARKTYFRKGIGPGCPAPDFELEDTDRGRVVLSDLRDRPVLLRFGSIS